MGCKPNWTREEIEYLSENWGSKAIPKIAGELDRSVNAVKLKAQSFVWELGSMPGIMYL